jgi:hypothetical protein
MTPINWLAASPTPGWQRLQIDRVEVTSRTVVLQFTGVAGLSYTVQKKDSLTSGPWAPLVHFAAWPTTGPREVTDTSLGLSPSRFYRITTPMQP